MSKFELRQEHIALLRRAYVRWEDCETGAPAIDCKRPYGNSGGVAQDVAEILGRERACCPHCGETLDDDFEEEAERLHAETETALAIILSAHGVGPGVYEHERGRRGPGKWRRCSDD